MIEKLMVLANAMSVHPKGHARIAKMSSRWARALRETPALARDLIELGGLFKMQEIELEEGAATLRPLDPYRLAYEAGQRDLAQVFLTAGGMTPDEIRQLMRNDDEPY